jgi:hypothetical protein
MTDHQSAETHKEALRRLDEAIGAFGKAVTETRLSWEDRYAAEKIVRDYLFELRGRMDEAIALASTPAAVVSEEGLINGAYSLPVEHYERVAKNLAAVWSNGNDGARTCILAAILRAALRPAVIAPPSSPVALREALEALSMWVTSERQKYRVAGGMPVGGFDNMTPIEIALAKVEAEIDRRAALQHEVKK